MTHLSTLKSTLKNIQSYFEKLENSKLTQEELDLLVENAKEIYERAIILRYKAYEEKIFPERVVTTVTIPEAKEIEVENPKPEKPMVMVDLTENNENQKEDIAENDIEEEQPAFDFSLFEDSVEEVKNEVLKDNTIEHISVSSISSDEHGMHEEKIVMEQITSTPVSDINKLFIEKFSKVDPSFSNQFGMSKLNTLIGSFGLNERLQYINELFDGSSDAFAEAVKSVDNMSSLEDALILASTYANQFNWDIDSETVEEFVTKIKRRYA